jgi:hypothetical protein
MDRPIVKILRTDMEECRVKKLSIKPAKMKRGISPLTIFIPSIAPFLKE